MVTAIKIIYMQDDVHLITRVSEYQEKGEMATPDFKLKFYTGPNMCFY